MQRAYTSRFPWSSQFFRSLTLAGTIAALKSLIRGNLIIKDCRAKIGRYNLRSPTLSSLIASFFNRVGDRRQRHLASQRIANHDFDEIRMWLGSNGVPCLFVRVPSLAQ